MTPPVVCGVIAEYDPFHLGHAFHLKAAREKTRADYVVCVMSGSFLQRGQPALFDAHTRAEAALKNGADLVLQMPCAFSAREADRFALGGVQILNALGCVSSLSFGCETEDIGLMEQAAQLIDTEPETYRAFLRRELDSGHSYAAASGAALSALLGEKAGILKSPNASLALSYLRAIRHTGSAMRPCPVLRTTDYHAKEAAPMPSASALRGAALRGDWQTLKDGLPADAYRLFSGAIEKGEICRPESLMPVLRTRLTQMTDSEIALLPGIGEGMESNIRRAVWDCVRYDEMLEALKTRRYTRGRIARALLAALLPAPSFEPRARLLGMKKSASCLLRDAGIPIVTRAAREACWADDLRADSLWQILAGLPCGDAYRRETIILDE